MKVNVLGRNIKEEFKQEVENAARFYASQLMSTRMMNTLELRIELRKGIKKLGGFIQAKHVGSNGQKQMTIKLNANTNASGILKVLAHEMIHAKQIAYKELQHRVWKSDKKCHVRWKGMEMGLAEAIPYRERPWEIEAFKEQGGLFVKYVDTIDVVARLRAA